MTAKGYGIWQYAYVAYIMYSIYMYYSSIRTSTDFSILIY
jgi:hypothetical protein